MNKHLALILLIAPTVTFAVGYDFAPCQEALPILAKMLLSEEPDPATFIPPGPDRNTWASRHARLAYIRANERLRVRATVKTIYEISEQYHNDRKSMTKQLREGKKHRLQEELEDAKADGQVDETTETLLALLINPDSPETEIIRAVNAWALTGAIEGAVEKSKENISSIFIRLLKKSLPSLRQFIGDEPDQVDNDSPDSILAKIIISPRVDEFMPANLRQARAVLPLASMIYLLSEIRSGVFEDLVGLIDLDKRLTPTSPEEIKRVSQIFQNQLSQVEVSLTEDYSATGENAGLITARLLTREKSRDAFLNSAKSLRDSPTLLPFFKDDLGRQILFVEDFGLPIDPVFQAYVSALKRIKSP